MNSEMLGLSYLQIALGKTDHLVAHINSNDKEPLGMAMLKYTEKLVTSTLRPI